MGGAGTLPTNILIKWDLTSPWFWRDSQRRMQLLKREEHCSCACFVQSQGHFTCVCIDAAGLQPERQDSNFLFHVFPLNREDVDSPHQRDMSALDRQIPSFCATQICLWSGLCFNGVYHFLWKNMRMMILGPSWLMVPNKSWLFWLNVTRPSTKRFLWPTWIPPSSCRGLWKYGFV